MLKTEWIHRVEESVPEEETGDWRTKVPMEEREKYFRKWSKEERKWVHSKDAYNWWLADMLCWVRNIEKHLLEYEFDNEATVWKMIDRY